MLYELEQKYGDERLVKYGVKVLATQIVKKPNWPLFEAYLLKFSHAFPNTIEVVVRIFETYMFHAYPIDTTAVRRFCDTFICQHALTDGHSEISWALWLALRLELELSNEAVSAILATGNSVCLILLLHLESMGLTAKAIDKRSLSPYANSDALTAENWLLAYEAGRRKWLRNTSVAHISGHPVFGPLLKEKVHFYIEKPALIPLFTLKEEFVEDFVVDWDTDENIDEYFEFEDESEDYTEMPPMRVQDIKIKEKSSIPWDDDDDF
jgi:hypothetical protein